MDYREIMEQANRLEAQAAALRKQAEEAKAKDAAKNTAKITKIKKARKELCAATINYLEAVDVILEAKEVEALEELFNTLFEELENSIKETKKRADMLDHIMKDMKNSSSKSTVKRVKISDDEKLLNFLRAISG